MIKIVFADDHPVTRSGLRYIIGAEEDMEVIDEACDSDGLLAVLEHSRPDVLILDINMPRTGGLELINPLKSIYPDVKILLLTVFPEEEFAIHALRLGADGFVSKEADPAELLLAIRKTVRNKKYINIDIDYSSGASDSNKARLLHERLSTREFQVLRMIAYGNSSAQIADKLFISSKTVATYRARILKKMKMKSSAELVKYCIKARLLI